MLLYCSFFFSSRRRHTRCSGVSWARRCVQETAPITRIIITDNGSHALIGYENGSIATWNIPKPLNYYENKALELLKGEVTPIIDMVLDNKASKLRYVAQNKNSCFLYEADIISN
eukprot:TRINITY_DN4729_c0_g1_i2.p2 TRINITY_DN4729_c0_g1~~TRINITY_DN4729_c0_g1_i2.p2  ORF type:complete len:115 (+),score=35.35 TRINITY_DN4729_c0_g1_i2:1-345(+)